MDDYNFTDPAFNFANVPFDQANYTSSVCIVEGMQKLVQTNTEVTQAFYILAALVALDVIITILTHLHRRRQGWN